MTELSWLATQFCCGVSALQPLGVPAQMVSQECGDEVVAVIVAGLPAQGEGDPGFLARALQQLRAELLREKLVGVAVVDQQIGQSGAVLDQRDRIVLAPCLPVIAEIAAERLDAPWHPRRCDNRRKRTDRAIAARMTQRDGERAVTAHRMAKNGLPVGVDRKVFADQLWQF